MESPMRREPSSTDGDTNAPTPLSCRRNRAPPTPPPDTAVELTVRDPNDLFPSAAVHARPTVILCGGTGMHWFFRAAADAHIRSLGPAIISQHNLFQSQDAAPAGSDVGPTFGHLLGASPESLYTSLEHAALHSMRCHNTTNANGAAAAAATDIGNPLLRRTDGGESSEADLPAGLRPMLVVVPVTDDGGSSRAIMDAIGGPAVGDLRNVILMLAKVTAQAAHAPVRRARRRRRRKPHHPRHLSGVSEDLDAGDSASVTPGTLEASPTAATPMRRFVRSHSHSCAADDNGAESDSGAATPFASGGALTDDAGDDDDIVPHPMTPTGDAAVDFFGAPELYDSERFLHTVLKMRLDPHDEKDARRQRDSLRGAFGKAEDDSALAAVGRAFDHFSVVVAHDAYSWRNASIGNVYLAGRMLEILAVIAAEQPRLATHLAVCHALERAALEMARMLGVPPHITVAPASSWTPGPATTCIADVLPRVRYEVGARLPLYQVGLERRPLSAPCGDGKAAEDAIGDDGQSVPSPSPAVVVEWGQTRISYGTDGKVAKHGAEEASLLPSWAEAGDPCRLATRVLERPDRPVPTAADAAAGPQVSLRAPGSLPLRDTVVFGSGSFLTSTLATAASATRLWECGEDPPEATTRSSEGMLEGDSSASSVFHHHHRSNSFPPPTPRTSEAIVLLNAFVDRETAVFFEPLRPAPAGVAVCDCAPQLVSSPVVRLLAALRRVAPHVSRVNVIACADGSVFANDFQKLSQWFDDVHESLECCAVCRAAVNDAGIDGTTEFLRCDAAIASPHHQLVHGGGGKPDGRYNGARSFAALTQRFVQSS